MKSKQPSSEPVWFFDLDNTLHNASLAIFPALNQNMNRFITKVLQGQGLLADQQEVDRLRQLYWRQYGATLLGLMKHHQVQAHQFLHETHDFDDLPAMMQSERGLLRLLKQLPGKKILLTNAPKMYAQQIVRQLGLHAYFDQTWSIESMYVHGQLKPKPSRALLRKIQTKEGLSARRCILVEDTVVNLKAAKQEGWRTIWMTRFLTSNPHAQLQGMQGLIALRPHYVDYKIRSIRQLRSYVRHWRA
jgi:putative hydrolase of the HAD superfamily